MSSGATLWFRAAHVPRLFPHYGSAEHLHEHDVLLGCELPTQLLIMEGADEPVEERFVNVVELTANHQLPQGSHVFRGQFIGLLVPLAEG